MASRSRTEGSGSALLFGKVSGNLPDCENIQPESNEDSMSNSIPLQHWAFTMKTRPPVCRVSRGRLAAGKTVSDVPRTGRTSDCAASSCAAAAVVACPQVSCLIVSELHKEGFVHRDIKPANILYREKGDVVLVDYGLIAKEDKKDVGRVCGNMLTQANVAVGTERFAAPEQFSGNPIDCHADIHALGVLIETCFHGQLPRRWRRIVCRATSSLPEQRYSSCSALSRAIAFRFVGEFAAVLFVIVSVALMTLAFVFVAQTMRHKDGVGPGGSAENADDPVKGKNVSDAAAEWLVP